MLVCLLVDLSAPEGKARNVVSAIVVTKVHVALATFTRPRTKGRKKTGFKMLGNGLQLRLNIVSGIGRGVTQQRHQSV